MNKRRRPRETARLQVSQYISVAYRPGIYGRTFVRSFTTPPDFPNKAPELLPSRLCGQSRYLGFPFRFVVHLHGPVPLTAVSSLSCSSLAVSCGHITASGMNPAERDETELRKRKGRGGERTNGRGADTKLAVGYGLFSPIAARPRPILSENFDRIYVGARTRSSHYIVSAVEHGCRKHQ